MAISLRPYQTEAIEKFGNFINSGGQRAVVVLPTGCGKTIFALSLAKKFGKRILWLAHREELITQPIRALRNVWPEATTGVVMGHRNNYKADFVFASVMTARGEKRLCKLNGFDLVIVDECHHSAADSYIKILEHVGCFNEGGPKLLGITATPERTDGKALDKVFEKIIYMYHIKDAIKGGYLCDVDVVTRRLNVNMSTFRLRNGDFMKSELAEQMLREEIVGQIAEATIDEAKDKKTIVFSTSVDQAHMICSILKSAGKKCAVVSGEMPSSERRSVLKGFSTGEYQIVVNCMVLTEGFDEPSVEVIVMGRPTASKPLYVQMAGRGLRIYPGKSKCTIVDMVGVTDCHNLIQASMLIGGDEEGSDSSREKDDSDEKDITDIDEKDIDPRLMRQVEGFSMPKSRFSWVKLDNGSFIMQIGKGRIILSPAKNRDDMLYDVLLQSAYQTENISGEPADLEFAQGIAEDAARRLNATSLASKDAFWRRQPASTKQIETIRKKSPELYRPGMSKGEASDILSRMFASSGRNSPATEKQKRLIISMGIAVNLDHITVGQASKIISEKIGSRK